MTGGVLGRGREALERARRVRAEHLLAVAEGFVTVDDVIRSAKGIPALRRIRIRQLLAAQPGWGVVSADRVLGRMRVLLDGRVTDRPTVGWLVDAVNGGVRLAAFCEARDRFTGAPWPGWPYFAPPDDWALGGAAAGDAQ